MPEWMEFRMPPKVSKWKNKRSNKIPKITNPPRGNKRKAVIKFPWSY